MHGHITRPPSLARLVCYTRLYTASLPTTVNTVPYLYYVLLLYYCCCICCVHIYRSPAVAHPPPLLLVMHGYTTQLYQVLLVPYLIWLLCLILLRSALRCTYDIPLPVRITFLLTRRRSPAAALFGCRQQQYILLVLKITVPAGVSCELKNKFQFCVLVNTRFLNIYKYHDP